MSSDKGLSAAFLSILHLHVILNNSFHVAGSFWQVDSNLKMSIFCVVASCSLVEDYRRFRGASTSETSVNFCETTRRNNPEDSRLHTRRRENLKSHWKTLSLDRVLCRPVHDVLSSGSVTKELLVLLFSYMEGSSARPWNTDTNQQEASLCDYH
jgi:hypothetical protein